MLNLLDLFRKVQKLYVNKNESYYDWWLEAQREAHLHNREHVMSNALWDKNGLDNQLWLKI